MKVKLASSRDNFLVAVAMQSLRALAAHQARAMKQAGAIANKYGNNKRRMDRKFEEPARAWVLVDAYGEVLGRLASRIVPLLCGKHKPITQNCRDTGDYVVVVNASKVILTGRGYDTKWYRHHSGYMGGLKSTPLWRVFEQNPVEPLRRAIFGMMPKNRLRHQRMSRLRMYPGPEHAHDACFHDPNTPAFRADVGDGKGPLQLRRIVGERETP